MAGAFGSAVPRGAAAVLRGPAQRLQDFWQAPDEGPDGGLNLFSCAGDRQLMEDL